MRWATERYWRAQGDAHYNCYDSAPARGGPSRPGARASRRLHGTRRPRPMGGRGARHVPRPARGRHGVRGARRERRRCWGDGAARGRGRRTRGHCQRQRLLRLLLAVCELRVRTSRCAPRWSGALAGSRSGAPREAAGAPRRWGRGGAGL